MKYAILDVDNIVQNVILWNGQDEYALQEGWSLIFIEIDAVSIGWVYSNNKFSEQA